MERRKSGTRVGVPVWTPAPGYPTPPSPAGSPPSWAQVEDEDFHTHMDENGIIGLRGMLEVSRTGEETFGEEEEDLLWDAGTPEPEDSPPRALDVFGSEPPSLSPGDCCPSHDEGDGRVALEDWSGDEDGRDLDEDDVESLTTRRPTDRARVRDLGSDGRVEGGVPRDQAFLLRGGMNHREDRKESLDDGCRVMVEETQAPLHNGYNDMQASKEENGVSLPPSSTGTPHTSVPPRFSSEEQTSHCEAEPFPELVITDNVPELLIGRFSHTLGSYQPIRHDDGETRADTTTLATTISPGSKIQPGRSSKGKEATAELERQTVDPHYSSQQPSVPCSQRTRPPPGLAPQQTARGQSSSRVSSTLRTPHSPGSPRTPLTDLKDVGRGRLSHPLPDLSKVEPRVRFPRSGYKPPVSGKPPRGRGSKPDAPLVFKSPADIVKEVLLSSTEGLSDSPAPVAPQRPLNSTLPEEFRCPLKASALVQQLQEDYNRLLTKYAEAENTIDRLRLEAKVSLYSESSKHSCPTLSGVLPLGSKVMTLSFPQAQRAELSASPVHPTQQTFSSESIRGTPTELLPAARLSEALSRQTQLLQIQIDEFEELLRTGSLKAREQIEGLSTLAQGLDVAERAYLASQERHLQLRGGRTGTFDPDRELEGLIFHAGMQLEELRERVEQTNQNQPTSEPGSSPPPHAQQLSGSLKEAEPQPESPVSAVCADVRVEVSSVSGVSDGDGAEDEEETLPSVLVALHHKHPRVENDFNILVDHSQTSRRPSEVPERSRRDTPRPARADGTENGSRWKTNDQQDSSKPVQLLMVYPPSSSAHSAQVVTAAKPLSASALPGQQASGSRCAGSRKSSSTRGETVERRSCEAGTRTLRAPPQDGDRSPETDSGFVGSDSSRVTPAIYSPIQKRAAVSHFPVSSRVTKPSVMENSRIKAQAVCVGRQADPSPPLHTQASPGRSAPCARPVGATPDSSEGGGGGGAGRWAPPHPAHCPAPRRWPSSGISEVGKQSGSEEEAQQGNRYSEPANQDFCHLRSSSPTPPSHYSSPPPPQSSAQLTNHQEALQSLQVEVDRLREHLEGTLRLGVPARSGRAPPSAMEDFRDPTSHRTSTPQKRCFRSLERPTPSTRHACGWRGEEDVYRRKTATLTPRRRSVSAHRLSSRLEPPTDSEHARFEAKPWTWKPSPASPRAERGARARTDAGTRPCRRSQQRSTSSDRAEESDDDDDDDEESRRPAPLCRHCVALRTRPSARPVRTDGSLTRTRPAANRCPLCGAPGPNRTRTRLAAPDQSSTQRQAWPVSPTHKEKRGVFLAAAPPPPVLGSVPVLHCVPVCPSVLYCTIPVASSSHPDPVYFPRKEERDHRSKVRGHPSRDHAVAATNSTRKALWHPAYTLTSGLQPTTLYVRSSIS
ncbi:uncharacterized protein akna isoform X2 [Brachyhypopomus gauderio]|uniref:uncharacterized protein akna isoform X2 n=1 Tax=Brachyhypopomus gauderio TaxID=698409 RepID=UPI0040416513